MAKHTTQAELDKAFAEGKSAAQSDKHKVDNPYANWEMYTAWNNGWKAGEQVKANERLIHALKRSLSVAKNESVLDADEIQLIQHHIEKLENKA